MRQKGTVSSWILPIVLIVLLIVYWMVWVRES